MANFLESPVYSPRFAKALLLIAEYHKFQVRKQNNIPYISHLMSVSALVFEAGGTEEEAIAGLCHDLAEDVCNTIFPILKLEFGDRVAQIVSALTEDKALPKEQRKKAYAQSVANSDRSVALVSAADKLHNIRCYAQTPALFKPEVAAFYAKLIPVYVEKLGTNHPFVKEMIDIWYKLDVFEIEEVFVDGDCGSLLVADYGSGLGQLATKKDFDLADRCVGSIFEALIPGEIVWIKEGIFRLDEDLDLVEMPL